MSKTPSPLFRLLPGGYGSTLSTGLMAPSQAGQEIPETPTSFQEEAPPLPHSRPATSSGQAEQSQEAPGTQKVSDTQDNILILSHL